MWVDRVSSLSVAVVSIALLWLTTSATQAATNLSQVDSPPGVQNPADPPDPNFPFDGEISFVPVPDNQRAIYIENNAFHVVRYDSPGQATALTGSLAGDILEFETTPDGAWLLYVVETAAGPDETDQRLYKVPTDASAAAMQVGPTAEVGTTGGGLSFEISEDAQRVVFVTSALTTDPMLPGLTFAVFELHSSVIAGGGVTTLTPAPKPVVLFSIAGTDSVVYVESKESLPNAPFLDLYRSPIGGGPRTRLNAMNEAVSPIFTVSPNGSRAIYVVIDDEDGSQVELRSEVTTGGSEVTLESLSMTRGVGFFLVSPDNARVVYLVGDSTAPFSELWSVAIDGGNKTELSRGVSGSPLLFQISPDSQRVVFTATNNATDEADQRTALYSAAMVQGLPQNAILLAGNLSGPGPQIFIAFFQITFDSTRVLHTELPVADLSEDRPGGVRLISNDIDATVAPVTLVSTLPGDQRIVYLFSLFDSSQALYVADQNDAEVYEAFLVPVEGGDAVAQNGSLPPGGDVVFAFPTSDSRKIVYHADEVADGRYDLWFSEVEGDGDPDVIFGNGFEP